MGLPAEYLFSRERERQTKISTQMLELVEERGMGASRAVKILQWQLFLGQS